MDRSPGFGSNARYSFFALFRLGLPAPPVLQYLKLATYINSPDRSTKSTRSHMNVLSVLVSTRFQVLFHSPPGVLFTFPSRYFFSIGHQVVFRLGGWSPHLPTGFHVSCGTPDPAGALQISPTGLSPCIAALPNAFGYLKKLPYAVQNPGNIATPGLASSAFARHYLRNLG